MNGTFYNGVSGLVAYQQGMDQISHNIANVNTTAYKGGRVSFRELLSTEMYVNTEEKPLVGHGVKADSIDRILRQGAIEQTGQPLDFAVMGEGFFAVENAELDQIQYTRNGTFNVSNSGRKGYLVTADGNYVLDSRKRRIQLEQGDNGTYDLEGLRDEVGVFQFSNSYELQPIGSASFLPTETSGKAKEAEDGSYTLLSYALERSNVEMSDEMANIIVTQRAFQFSAKMIQAADEMETIVNQLR